MGKAAPNTQGVPPMKPFIATGRALLSRASPPAGAGAPPAGAGAPGAAAPRPPGIGRRGPTLRREGAAREDALDGLYAEIERLYETLARLDA